MSQVSKGTRPHRLAVAFLALTGAMVTMASDAGAQQNSETTSASAGATVVTAISLTKTTDLNFGELVAGGSSGSVVVTAAGSRSATGGTTLGNSTGLTQAVFTVAGDPSATYSITLPSSATITSSSNNMTVNTFTSSPSGTGTLSAGGSQTLNVGATLQVGSSQASGTYTGSFDVTVAYN